MGGPAFQCWAKPGSQPLTTWACLVLLPFEQYQTTLKSKLLLLLPTTARLNRSRRPRLVVVVGLMNR